MGWGDRVTTTKGLSTVSFALLGRNEQGSCHSGKTAMGEKRIQKQMNAVGTKDRQKRPQTKGKMKKKVSPAIILP